MPRTEAEDLRHLLRVTRKLWRAAGSHKGGPVSKAVDVAERAFERAREAAKSRRLREEA